jgi:hypothetical protein
MKKKEIDINVTKYVNEEEISINEKKKDMPSLNINV